MTPGWESDYGFQEDNYTPMLRFRKDPNGNFSGPAAEGVARMRRRLSTTSRERTQVNRSRLLRSDSVFGGSVLPICRLVVIPRVFAPRIQTATCQIHVVPAPQNHVFRGVSPEGQNARIPHKPERHSGIRGSSRKNAIAHNERGIASALAASLG